MPLFGSKENENGGAGTSRPSTLLPPGLDDSRGFSYIRIEFLPTYHIDIYGLCPEDLKFNRGIDEFYIRGEKVPRDCYRMSLVFKGEDWGHPGVRIADNCVLLEVEGITRRDCAYLREYWPLTIDKLELNEEDEMILHFRILDPCRIVHIMTLPENVRNGDCMRFLDKYLEWVASKSVGGKDLIAVYEAADRSPGRSSAAVKLRDTFEGSRIILDVRLNIYRLRQMMALYDEDRSLPRGKYMSLIKEVLDDRWGGHIRMANMGILPTFAWEMVTLSLGTAKHKYVFDVDALKRWLLFEVHGGGDSDIGAHILVLAALHSNFRELFVANVLLSMPELVKVCEEICDLTRLCRRNITEWEVEEIVHARGIQMCVEAIALPFFIETPAYIGLCGRVPEYRYYRDNALNEGILWIGLSHRPFYALGRDSFKCLSVWVFWRFLSSVWSMSNFDKFMLTDSEIVIENALEHAYRKFAPCQWVRGSSDIIPEDIGRYERRCKVKVLKDKDSLMTTVKNANPDRRRKNVSTDVSDVEVSSEGKARTSGQRLA
ncbi:hypothetical protein ANPL_02345 [Anaplasma platys]|uniref:Uncharacterized protein n=1 Tax=Anaplasma platys TaxID=949 RepID=A0A858PY97_9RICK|nr:hypothetical protein [Anaplasma platys]QJC27540.1 hypothetical protein ANPL_02345 [Anaplasma platys]